MSILAPIASPLVAITDKVINRYVISPEPTDLTSFKSALGTPVYSPLELLDRRPNTGIVAGQLQTGNPPLLLRIDTTIITISLATNVIKTSIQGRDGTVKEYIGLEDYIIEVEGAIVSPYLNVFPEDDVKKLIDWLTRPEQVEVASDFLLLGGITNIVVTDRKISQKLGSRNEVPFSFSAISDRSEEIILTTNDIP